MSAAINYARGRKEKQLEELIAFLSIPSISTQPQHAADMQKAAEWLSQTLVSAGMEHVEVIPTAGHPLVYADWCHAPDQPTVLIYGHYDVQPVDPLDLWQSPPFTPVVRDEFIYARGAADDKGQVYIHVKAVEALLATDGRLPVNVKFIVEGEEESGGKNISAFIPQNKAKLAADVALISDTAMVSPEKPAIVYGLRGMAYFLLDITGPPSDLHSGSYGGGVDNPLNVLGHLIAKLKDEAGHILIPGFYDQVRPLTAEERAILAKFPLDEAAWLAEAGLARPWGEPEYNLVERLGARPTLDVNGIIGGYVDPGAKTVLPATVHAKISMRLVPDQTPQEIEVKFADYLADIMPDSVTYDLRLVSTALPSISDLNNPGMAAAVQACVETFGVEPVFMREGGSLPVVSEFQSYLNLETIMLGFGLPGDNNHAPNERFSLVNFYNGIVTSIRFLQTYGAG